MHIIIYSDTITRDLPLSVWLPSSFGMVGNPIIQEHNKNSVNEKKKKTPSA